MKPLLAFTRCVTITSSMLAGLAQAATLMPGETVALQPSLQVTLDNTLVGVAWSNGSTNSFMPASSHASAPSGLVNVINLSKATVSATEPSKVSATDAKMIWAPSVQSVEVDASTGKLLTAKLNGGLRLEAPAIGMDQEGGTLSLSNLYIDLARGGLYADAVAAEGTLFEVKSIRTAIVDFSATPGIESLNLAAAQKALDTGVLGDLNEQGWTVVSRDSSGFDELSMTGWLEFGQARLTDEFRALILAGFGTNVSSPAFAQINGLTFDESTLLRMGMSVRVAASGSGRPPLSVAPALLDSTQMLRPVPERLAAPEPGSAVMFGMGLMGLACATRKRHHPTGQSASHRARHA